MLGMLLGVSSASAQEPVEVAPKPKPGEQPPKEKRRLNVPTKTLGGAQFWGDTLYFRGWRIQQNVLSGHYRLLDPKNYRRAWGTRRTCETKLAEIRKEKKLKPLSGKAVILLHGIVRTSKSMKKLSKALEKEGYTVVPFDYPSTRVKIERSAAYLQQVIENLEGIDEINFVTHSMGGLVVRAWTRDYHDCRVGRMVMIAVPNLGSRMADRLKGNLLFKIIYGAPTQQLGTDPDGYIAKLPVPGFEFAVIAGMAGTPGGYNPLVPGDDDGTVSVASTRLPGATDSIAVKSLHSFVMNQSSVIDYTRRFLKKGRLRKKGPRQPVPKEQPAPRQAVPKKSPPGK